MPGSTPTYVRTGLRAALALVGLVVLALVVHRSFLDVGFLSDDYSLIRRVHGADGAPRMPTGLFATPLPADWPESAPRFYRPLWRL